MTALLNTYICKTTSNRENAKYTRKSNSSPHPGKSDSSKPGPALKQATLGMVKKNEEKKKKEEKDKLKNNRKKNDESNIIKNRHRKKKKQQNKQNKLKRIYFL